MASWTSSYFNNLLFATLQRDLFFKFPREYTLNSDTQTPGVHKTIHMHGKKISISLKTEMLVLIYRLTRVIHKYIFKSSCYAKFGHS